MSFATTSRMCRMPGITPAGVELHRGECRRHWVLTARRHWPEGRGGLTVLVPFRFPEAGCANFFLESDNPEDAKIIDFMAHGFAARALYSRCAFGYK